MAVYFVCSVELFPYKSELLVMVGTAIAYMENAKQVAKFLDETFLSRQVVSTVNDYDFISVFFEIMRKR